MGRAEDSEDAGAGHRSVGDSSHTNGKWRVFYQRSSVCCSKGTSGPRLEANRPAKTYLRLDQDWWLLAGQYLYGLSEDLSLSEIQSIDFAAELLKRPKEVAMLAFVIARLGMLLTEGQHWVARNEHVVADCFRRGKRNLVRSCMQQLGVGQSSFTVIRYDHHCPTEQYSIRRRMYAPKLRV